MKLNKIQMDPKSMAGIRLRQEKSRHRYTKCKDTYSEERRDHRVEHM
jgi:hypothetical protein